MKWFVLLIFSLCLLCCISKPELFEVVVLVDRSDSTHIPAPTTDQLRSVLPTITHKQTGIRFRLRNIGENEYQPAYSLSLAPVSVLENTIRRKIAVDQFMRELESLIGRENKKVFSEDGSSILTVLTEELESLSKTSASNKTVLLYSDGYEYSHLLNVYDPIVAKELLSKPAELAERYRSLTSRLSLSGIDLYIIYYPHDKVDARRFRAIVIFYERLFDDTGLIIHVGFPNATTPL